MDSFAGGIHYAYDYSRNSFIPANQAVVATSAPTNYQTAPNFGGQDGKSLSGSHPGSSTSSGPHRALNVDTSTLEALRTERSPSSRAKPSEAIDNTTSGHIPRPRNAFMIFRAEFSSDKINHSVEHDNRHISRIIGHCWNKLSEEEKLVWRRKADLEKLAHLRKHPDYRFTPTVRTRKPLKRKVNRNGGEELLRCQQVANLLLSGREGDDLALAIKQMGPRERPSSSITLPQHHVRKGPYSPPFRSPFLPPSKLPARASSCRFSSGPAINCNANRSDLPRQTFVPPVIDTIASPHSREPGSSYFLSSTENDQQSTFIASRPCPQLPSYLYVAHIPNSAHHPDYIQVPSYSYMQSSSALNTYPIQHSPGPSIDITQPYAFLSSPLPPASPLSRFPLTDTTLGD